MNAENDNTDDTNDTNDTNDDIAWFEIEAAAFVGALPQGHTPNLMSRVAQRMRRRIKLDRLVENFIFGFLRSGAAAAFYLAVAYAAKIAFGIGLTFSPLR